MVRRHDPEFPGSRWLAMFMRWRGVGTMIYAVAVAFMGVMALAWKFSPRLTALEGRATASEVHSAMIDRKTDSLWLGQNVLLKSSCLDRTKVQQQLIGMNCPDSLYREVRP